MKKLFLVLFFALMSLRAYSWPGNGNGNGNGHSDGDDHPGHSNPPNDNCAHCDDNDGENDPAAPITSGTAVFVITLFLIYKFSNTYKKP